MGSEARITESKLKGYEYFIFSQMERDQKSVPIPVDRKADHFSLEAQVDLVNHESELICFPKINPRIEHIF